MSYAMKQTLNQLPVLYARGTYHEVGYSIGRTFKTLIQDSISKIEFLETTLIPAYNTERGGRVFKKSLNICKERYPIYVEELEGISEGAEIPFYKIFLLHIHTIILPPRDQPNVVNEPPERGCSTLLYFKNSKEILLSHNEDAGKFMINNIFIVDAEILDQNGTVIEKWASVTYAGFLPGATSGYNVHGVLHSMNTMVPWNTNESGTPTIFLMRALLAAKSFDDAQRILKDSGAGSSDGFNINIIEFNENVPSIVANIEGAPGTHDKKESLMDVYHLKEGESYNHCNRYLRLKVPEQTHLVTGSFRRHQAIDKYKEPYDMDNIIKISSDTTDKEYPVFRGFSGSTKDQGVTVLVGIFDTANRSWIIYTDVPTKSKPTTVLPISMNCDKRSLERGLLLKSKSRPILGYWDIRGYGQAIRHILKYSKIDFEDKLYPCTKELMLNEWNQEKDKLGLEFPNLPYWIDGDIKMTESRAIIQQICRNYNPSLLPKTDEAIRKSQMLDGVITDIWKMLGLACYSGEQLYLDRYDECVPEMLRQVSQFVGTSKWCIGNEISYLDFLLYEILYHNRTYKKEILKGYANLEEFMKKFEELPEINNYMKDSGYIKYPCFRPWAKIPI